MPTEVISALIATGGALLSAVVAWFVSRAAANKEIEKLKLTWAREDVVSSDDEFAEMAAVVSRYIGSGYHREQNTALERVGAVRSKECGALAKSLDCLHEAIRRDPPNQVNEYLTEVIEEKRKAKGHAKNAN